LKETDKLLDKRRKVIEAKWQERISSHVEREKIALMKIHQELVELANKGETEELIKLLEALAEEAVDTKERPRGFADTRDERGSTLLAIAAQHDHHEIVEFLLTRSKLLVEQAKQIPREAAERQEKIAKILKANPNARDCRGWTPASIAVFHESKRSLRLLLDNGADPKLVNQYNKNAYDFAKDDLDAANCVVKSRQEVRSPALSIFLKVLDNRLIV
jgi:ankyrin repeat protein